MYKSKMADKCHSQVHGDIRDGLDVNGLMGPSSAPIQKKRLEHSDAA